MRQRIESPDSYDGFIDRSPSIQRPRPTPRLLVNGQTLDQPAECQHIKDHAAYLKREGDFDRAGRENTARHLLDEIEAAAIRKGTSQILSRLLVMVDALEREPDYPTIRARLSDWIEDAKTLHAHLGSPKFNRAVQEMWFRNDATDGAEVARIRRNLADALA